MWQRRERERVTTAHTNNPHPTFLINNVIAIFINIIARLDWMIETTPDRLEEETTFHYSPCVRIP